MCIRDSPRTALAWRLVPDGAPLHWSHGLQHTGVADILAPVRAALPGVNVVKGFKGRRLRLGLEAKAIINSCDGVLLLFEQFSFEFHFDFQGEADQVEEHLC